MHNVGGVGLGGIPVGASADGAPALESAYIGEAPGDARESSDASSGDDGSDDDDDDAGGGVVFGDSDSGSGGEDVVGGFGMGKGPMHRPVGAPLRAHADTDESSDSGASSDSDSDARAPARRMGMGKGKGKAFAMYAQHMKRAHPAGSDDDSDDDSDSDSDSDASSHKGGEAHGARKRRRKRSTANTHNDIIAAFVATHDSNPDEVDMPTETLWPADTEVRAKLCRRAGVVRSSKRKTRAHWNGRRVNDVAGAARYALYTHLRTIVHDAVELTMYKGAKTVTRDAMAMALRRNGWALSGPDVSKRYYDDQVKPSARSHESSGAHYAAAADDDSRTADGYYTRSAGTEHEHEHE